MEDQSACACEGRLVDVGTGVLVVGGSNGADSEETIGLTLVVSSAGVVADMESELRSRARLGSITLDKAVDKSSSGLATMCPLDE